MGNNVVEQKVKVDTKPYVDGIRKATDETKRATNEANKALGNNGKSWDENAKQVKFSVASITKELKSLGKEMMSNAKNGLMIGGGAAAANFAKNSIMDSAKAMLSFGEAMSRVKIKTGGANKDINDLQDSLTELARTGASLQSIPDAFDEIFSATNDIGKSKSVMEGIAKFASGTESGDASNVAKFVRTNLTSQNKEVNKGNSNELLGSVASMVKTGAFKNLDEAMSAFGGIDANAMGMGKISSKSAASMLSAASPIGNKEQSIAAINELIKGSQNGFEKNYALRGMMGGNNPFKDGKIDPEAIARAAKVFKSRGVDDAGNKNLLMQSGLSEDAANGLINIFKNADKFKDGIKKFEEGATSSDKVIDQLNDNLSGKIRKVGGNIHASFLEILNHLSQGEFKKAGGDIMSHPGVIAGGVAVGLGGGAIASKVLKTVGGMFGVGKGKGIAGGIGGALDSVGIPVRVMNWNEQNGNPLNLAEKAAESAPDLIKKGGKISSVLGVLGKVSAVGTAGYVGYEAGKAIQDTEIGGKGAEVIADAIFSVLQKVGIAPTVHQIEVTSNDPALLAKPKKNDNPRNPHGF